MKLYILFSVFFMLLAGCQSPGGTNSYQGSASTKTDFSYWTLNRIQKISTGDESYAQSESVKFFV